MEAIHADAGPALHVWPRDIGPPPDPGLRQYAQKLEQDGDGGHAGDAARVEGRRDLDEIGSDEIEAPEIADQTLGFKRREAARLRRSRRIDRIKRVNIEGEISGAAADDLSRLLGCPPPALVVELLNRNHAHAAAVAELPHFGDVEAAADPDLDRALRIDEPLLDRPSEWRAVMETRAEIVVAGIAVGIELHQAERSIFGNGSQDRQRDRMIADHRERGYASRIDGSEEGSDFGERALQLEGPFDPSIPEIGDADEVEGRHAGRLVDLADERRLVADVARAVARACAIGDTTVEWHSHEADVDLVEPHSVREAEKSRDSTVAWLQLRISELRVTLDLLDHASFFSRRL